MTRKRKGKISGSTGNQDSSSPASSPEEKSVCKKVAMSAGYSHSNADLMVAIADIARQNAAMASALDAISRRLDNCSGLVEEVKELKNRVETLEKKLLRKTVVIHGLKDSRLETIEDTEQKVRDLASVLGDWHLDVDLAMRMGKFQEGKIRPIQVTLVRQKQIIQLLQTKWKLRKREDTRMVYIDEACTPEDLRKRSRLIKYAKLQKDINNANSYRLIGNVLEVHGGTTPGKFHVNEEDKVVAWKEKTGEATANRTASRQPRTEGAKGHPKVGLAQS